MNESFEFVPNRFVLPDIEKERGEFERVAQVFNLDCDTLMFLAKEEGKLQRLDAATWDVLDNTDSKDIQRDDWKTVQKYSESQEHPRDWRGPKKEIEEGVALKAPIIFKYNGKYHLVSGNTRLMVARALGVTPQVLIFEYIHDRSNEESS